MKDLLKVLSIFLAFMITTIVSATEKRVNGIPYVQLNNGEWMPRFGISTFNVPGDSVAEDAVAYALKCGYRHIDTAHAYRVERGVGKAVKESGIPRSEIWITSKLWPTEYGEGKTVIPFCTYASTGRDATLQKLNSLTPTANHLTGFGTSGGNTGGVESWLRSINMIK